VGRGRLKFFLSCAIRLAVIEKITLIINSLKFIFN
jgi:hypothetical protein